jgi:hypothetical protein
MIHLPAFRSDRDRLTSRTLVAGASGVLIHCRKEAIFGTNRGVTIHLARFRSAVGSQLGEHASSAE